MSNNNENIGLGIITYNREDGLKKAFDFHHPWVDELVIVNDGDPIDELYLRDNFKGESLTFLESEHNGVGHAKNKALTHLLGRGCDHIFLMEDDIFLRSHSGNVFSAYIEASKKTGIQHFNYSQHGMMNKTWPGGDPNPRIVVKIGGQAIPLYPHCVGAFSYYSARCLEKVGMMDPRYYNACEHVDHTFEIIKAGMHPPFWYFADIEDSWKYLGDEEWSLKQSTISSRSDHNKIVSEADKIFFSKHGCYPGQIPLTSEEVLVETLKDIKRKYGK